MPTPREIIAAYCAKADGKRRAANAFLFRKILTRLRNVGRESEAKALERCVRGLHRPPKNDFDPGDDGVVRKRYGVANGALDPQHRLPAPARDIEAVRRRELWRTYRRNAATLSGADMERRRLIMVTVTESNKPIWGKRLQTIRYRNARVQKALGPHSLWYLHAYDVMSDENGRSPHVHSLYVVDDAAREDVRRRLRPFGATHLRWYDFREVCPETPKEGGRGPVGVTPPPDDGNRDSGASLHGEQEHEKESRPPGDKERGDGEDLHPDRERRRRWLHALAYVMKVSGTPYKSEASENDPLRLPAPWHDAFELVRKDPRYSQDTGSHAICVKAMYGHYAPGTRIFRNARTLRAEPARGGKGVVAKARLKRAKALGSKGRPRTDPGKAALAALRAAHPTMKARAAAAGIDVKTLRRLMNGYGLPTPRGKGK